MKEALLSVNYSLIYDTNLRKTNCADINNQRLRWPYRIKFASIA
jgi:hypothetical protein